MPYLLKGNAAQIFSAFGHPEFARSSSDASRTIVRDLPATHFLGTEAQARWHMKLWKRNSASYTQGDMSAGILKCLLGGEGVESLKKADEDFETYSQNLVCQHFAFLNDQQQACGLMIMYRKDNPSQWMLGFIKNTQAEPQAREVTLLSSVDLNTYVKKPTHGVRAILGPLLAKQFIEQFDSVALQRLLKNIVDEKGAINPYVARLDVLLRVIQVTADKKIMLKDPLDIAELDWENFFADNPALDLIIQYHIHRDLHLSYAILKDCLLADKGLRKELEDVKLTADNKQLNKNLLQMTLVFYEEGTLEKNRELLNDREFIRLFGALMWSREQIKLIAFMRSKNYSKDLMPHILDKEVYFGALSRLVSMGLVDGASQHFENPQKLEQLQYIHEIADEDCKRLCLVFWLKGSLTLDGYKQIVTAATKYPLMASTVVDLDKKGVVNDGIDGLRKLTDTPEDHLQQSIAYHFFSAPGEKFYTRGLENFSVKELEIACSALNALKASEVTKLRSMSKLVVKNNQQGKEMRIFLPQIAAIKDITQRKALIDILYAGVTGSISIQGKEVKALDDEDVKAAAYNLGQRYSCVHHLLALGFSEEVATWAAQEHNHKARCFRQIILRVEEQCKIINERLYADAVNNSAMYKAWQGGEGSYRKQLYYSACELLMKSHGGKQDVLDKAIAHIKDIERTILVIVDPPIESDVRRAFIFISNLLIAGLTLGIANYVKYKQTGNAWFFTQTQAGEEVRALSQEIVASMPPL